MAVSFQMKKNPNKKISFNFILFFIIVFQAISLLLSSSFTLPSFKNENLFHSIESNRNNNNNAKVSMMHKQICECKLAIYFDSNLPLLRKFLYPTQIRFISGLFGTVNQTAQTGMDVCLAWMNNFFLFW